MSCRWRRSLRVLVAAMLAIGISAGCRGPNDMSEPDLNGLEPGAVVSAARASERGDTADWPEGWLVVHQEEWIPVLDELGRSLHAARAEFRSGDGEAAAAEVARGIEYLEAQVSAASVRDRRALSSAIATLRAFAVRLGGDEEVTLEQLDIAFANAYRSNLEREALAIERGTSQPYLDRPGAHLQRAVEQYEAEEPEEAAREIDRASAYLRLEGNRHDLGERAQLVEAAQDLEQVAARVRILEIRDRTEMTRVFSHVLERWRELARAPRPPPSLGLMSQ